MRATDISKRYILALSLIALLSASILALSLWSGRSAETYSELINTAGKQRMLSQRIVLNATLVQRPVSQTLATARVRETLLDSIDEFNTAHQRLREASLTIPTVRNIYAPAAGLDEQVARFTQGAEALAEVQDNPERALDRLLLQGEAILVVLDRATGAYEAAARQQSHRIKRIEWAAFFATLMVLALEAALIFHPAIQALHRAMGELEYARDRAIDAHDVLSRFLDDTGRAIRSPLHALMGTLEALRLSDLNEHQRKVLASGQEAGRELDRVTQTLVQKSGTGDAEAVRTASFPPVQLVGAEEDANRPLRVLVVDDNLTNRLVLRTLLETQNCAVSMAENGPEAIRYWQAKPVDIILMDIDMPGMSGIETTQAIRAEEKHLSRPHTPVIAVTANTRPEQIARYENTGMSGCLSKPVSRDRLFSAMNRARAHTSFVMAVSNGTDTIITESSITE